MIPRIHDWLLAQCHRDDSVGSLARLWVAEANAVKDSNSERWLSAKAGEQPWMSGVQQVKEEFAEALELLRQGKRSPTFPSWLLSPQYEDKLRASAEYHRAHPEEAPEVYLHRKRRNLLQALESKTLVYLDTNHWINLTEAFLKRRSSSPIYSEMIPIMTALAEGGSLACPISFPLFLELMKQTDPDTRIPMSKLMDCLSGGVCFKFPPDIEEWELRQQMLKVLLLDQAPHLVDEVWTKVGYVGGELLPVNDAFSEEDIVFIQKTSIDGMWDMPLLAFAELDPKDLPECPFVEIAAATNADAGWYRSSNLSFAEILKREKAFLVRRRLDDMKRIAQELWDLYPEHRDFHLQSEHSTEAKDIWCLPSIQIKAAITAHMIYDKMWKFDSHDILDSHHAALAVPYCDALFCDKPTANILTAKRLGFDKAYQTKVLSEPAEILSYLKSL